MCLVPLPRPDDAVVVQFLELLDDGVAFHDQVQCRRLHAPHRNHLPAARGERVGARRVEPNHPVGPLAQPCGIAQVYALSGVFQVFPRLVQILCHVAVHPQALDGLLLECGRKVEHQIENQVTFAAGIRAVHEHVGLFHHLAHYRELLSGALIERRKRNQVTHAPGDAVVLADKASVALRELLSLDPLEHRAVVLVGNRGLFGDEKNHGCRKDIKLMCV